MGSSLPSALWALMAYVTKPFFTITGVFFMRGQNFIEEPDTAITISKFRLLLTHAWNRKGQKRDMVPQNLMGTNTASDRHISGYLQYMSPMQEKGFCFLLNSYCQRSPSPSHTKARRQLLVLVCSSFVAAVVRQTQENNTSLSPNAWC